MKRASWVIATLLLISATWWFRWELRESHQGTVIYVLDHWTGALYVVSGDERMPVHPPEQRR